MCFLFSFFFFFHKCIFWNHINSIVSEVTDNLSALTLRCLDGVTPKYLASRARMCLIISPHWKSWTRFLLGVTSTSPLCNGSCTLVSAWEKDSFGLLCRQGPHHFTAVRTYLQLLLSVIKADIPYMGCSPFIQHEQHAKMDERFTGRKQLNDKNVKCYAASCVQLTKIQIYTLFQSKPFIR